MRIATTSKTIYSYNELPEDTQSKVLENLRFINVDDSFWHDYIDDDCREVAKIIGIDIDKIYFSGFSSQGDGACFVGSYDYAKGAAKAIREYAPQDTELHAIADTLQDIQRRHFYGVSANVTHSGHYYHEYCTSLYVYDNFIGEDANADLEDSITEALRDFMRWIYKRLETDYWYMTEDAQVLETIECNEYEFTESGNIA